MSGGFPTACSIPPWHGRRPHSKAPLKIIKMTSLDLGGKRVLIREDLNVPIQDGAVSSDARIRAALPTIQAALTAKARVLVMSHLGRPEEGKFAEEFSLAPVAKRLAQLLGVPVKLQEGLAGRRRRSPRRGRAARERALQQGRKEGRGRAGAENGCACAMSTSWMPSARRIAPKPALTASPSSRRWRAPARSWSASCRRWRRRSRSRRGRCSPSSPAPRCRPSSPCSNPCSARSIS